VGSVSCCTVVLKKDIGQVFKKWCENVTSCVKVKRVEVDVLG